VSFRRVAFALLPLAVIALAVEGGLRLAGYSGEPDRTVSWCREHALAEPPFFERQAVFDVPALVPRIEGQPQPFAPEKPTGTRRLFAFGGSAVHGYGFTRAGAWPDQLEGLLAGAWTQDVQVINAGVIAWSSQQVLALVKDVVANHDPDAILLYSGNNELLEWFDARRYLPPDELRAWTRSLTAARRLRAWRSYRFLSGLLSDVEVGHWGQTSFSDDEALPWPARGRLDETARAFARAGYRYHLRRIVEVASAAGVPVFASTVAVNWDDPPGEFDFGSIEPPEARDALALADAALGQGRAPDAHFAAAQRAWPEAITWHRKARMLRRHGHTDAALEAYREAVARDENPHRAPPWVEDVLRSTPGITVVEGAEAIAALSVDGVVDWGQVYDHCHPTPEAHGALAASFAEALLGLWPGEVVVPPDRTGHVLDGWLGHGVDVERGHYLRDPGGERSAWWASAATPVDPEAWLDRGVVAWHTFHADCERGRTPCLEDAFEAFERAAAAPETACRASAALGRAWFWLDRSAAGRWLDEAQRCAPDDPTTAWYRSRLD